MIRISKIARFGVLNESYCSGTHFYFAWFGKEGKRGVLEIPLLASGWGAGLYDADFVAGVVDPGQPLRRRSNNGLKGRNIVAEGIALGNVPPISVAL